MVLQFHNDIHRKAAKSAEAFVFSFALRSLRPERLVGSQPQAKPKAGGEKSVNFTVRRSPPRDRSSD
jgi:hypothetical protein